MSLVLVFGKKVTLQLRQLYFKLYYYSSRKTIEIFGEFNLQFLNTFYMNSSIVTFWYMSLNVGILSFEDALTPFSWSLFNFMFTALVLNIQKKGQYLNWSLIKELNVIFLLRSVMNGATLTSALNFWLAASVIDYVWLLTFKSLYIIISRSFCWASACKVFLPSSIHSLAISLFIIK